MPLEELLRTGRIRRERISPAEIQEALKLAARDLRLARKILREDADWGFAVAYNAVLQAGRACMFADGYRPATAEGHKNTFAFLLAALGPEHEELITYFDRMRAKRNVAIYRNGWPRGGVRGPNASGPRGALCQAHPRTPPRARLAIRGLRTGGPYQLCPFAG